MTSGEEGTAILMPEVGMSPECCESTREPWSRRKWAGGTGDGGDNREGSPMTFLGGGMKVIFIPTAMDPCRVLIRSLVRSDLNFWFC